MPTTPNSPPRALVTGGTGNLGDAVARLLLEAGYEVHVTVRDERAGAALASGPGHETLRAHVADLSQADDCARLAGEIGGPLAALVATVGGFVGGPFAQIDPAAIDQQYELNLKSTLLTLRFAHPLLAASPGGAAVVLVANRPALAGGAGVAVTGAMKAAVVHLAKSLAEEWKGALITVNAVAPGMMDTPQNRAAMPAADATRWPTPAQVAAVIRFLLSAEGRIVSGAVLPVFGRS